MAGYDEQLINPEPGSLRHADDALAFRDSSNPPQLPPIAEVKWVELRSEREDRPGQLQATRSREVIRNWAEMRHAKPVLLGVVGRSDPINGLRLQISNRRNVEYELISWDEWFALMDGANLVFIFQDHTADGGTSDLYRFVPESSVKRQ